ncbi:Hsp70 family protein [Actinoplanes oblitus]|uniref:Hsp70 family protein n=1 Tax=Actinoplanes oblitus TaxID=3040509 RepID=A0ABY8W6G3_9ACTN|nr:Hsp70 family protein [Actinoplanes oblitus]WIM93429.1 Hsp70 family protein [Actinoplanes oblitus]
MTTFGIDLGTTYSCIARVDDTGVPVIIPNEAGAEITPSVVHFVSPHRVVVGDEAKDAAKRDAERVVSLIKRHIGQSGTELEIDGITHTPESISALIVRALARGAAAATGETVRDVVITVPAYFGVAERRATEQAGEIAGLTVVNVVPEPVAAALHYGALNEGEDQTILVYDLGGGTFDTTVIRLSGGDVTVVCTDGDHRLGGADWDERIVAHLRDCFVAEHPDSGAGDSEEFLQEVTLVAEKVKKALSVRTSYRQTLRFEGRTAAVDVSRETFEALTADLLDQTVDITGRALAVADRAGAGTPDSVLLVGGSTYMPAVARALRERFGFDPRLHDPHLAVAKGAAMFALRESIRIRLAHERDEPGDAAIRKVARTVGVSETAVRTWKDREIVNVVPRAFGVGVVARDTEPEEGKREVSHLLLPNDPLPAAPTKQFYTPLSNQTSIRISIWEQAGPTVSHELDSNRQIGEGRIERLPPLPKNSPIDITFALDEVGLLTVSAVELVTGKAMEHVKVQIGGLDDKRVDELRAAVARLS